MTTRANTQSMTLSFLDMREQFEQSKRQFEQSQRDFQASRVAYQNAALGPETVEAFMSLIEFAIEAGLFKDSAILSRDDAKRLARFYSSRVAVRR